MRLPLGKSFQCSSSMDVSSQTAGFFRAVSQRGGSIVSGFLWIWLSLLLNLFILAGGNRFCIHLGGCPSALQESAERQEFLKLCKKCMVLGYFGFFIVFCLFCMHDWHGAVVLFLEHLITIDTPRLNKMFFYLVKECSLGLGLLFFFPLHNFSLMFWKERLSFGGCSFIFSLKPSGLCILQCLVSPTAHLRASWTAEQLIAVASHCNPKSQVFRNCCFA